MYTVYTRSGTDYRDAGQETDAQKQRQLYSPQGLTYRYEENGCRNTSRFRVNRTPQWDILTEERLSTEKINRNPIMFGIRLTDEQVEQIKDGQPVYIEGMRYENRIFDGYLVMDDKLTRGLAYTDKDPNEWVKYGKYTMRRMDRDLIERGYTVRALVQWWGNMGETARPYLWKERPEDTGYKESWGDPRKPRKNLRQDRAQERDETPVIKRSKGRGL